MSGSDNSVQLLIEVLVATGLLTAISETVRWFLSGKGRQKIDTAKVVQGMALDLLRPLHTELDLAQEKMSRLNAELESVLGWAIIAHALLDSHSIDYPPVPAAMVQRKP